MIKKVLVTGATGFIGSYVVENLLRRGYQVIATSMNKDKAIASTWFETVKYIPFDLKDLRISEDYYTFFDKPDLLIHLAWEGLPNYNSAFHLEENLPRHYNFLKNLVTHGLRDISVTGTCFEYGKQEGCLSEDLPSMPSNQYAIAKDNLRFLLTQLKQSNPLELKWVRLFYLFGKGQSPNSLFSQLLAAIDKGDDTFNMSPGDQLRDYMEISMAAEYLVSIATQNEVTGIINCCSGIPVPVKELVSDYLKKTGKNIKLNLGYYPYSDLEPKDFWGDNTKLKTILKNEQRDKGICT